MLRSLPLLCALLPSLAFAADLAKLDELHTKRQDPAAEKELGALFDAALKENPADVEVLWRQARYYVWQADGLPNGDAKKKLGKVIWAIGDKIIKLAPQRVEGHYYGSLGVAQYSQAVGILNAIGEGLEGKFNERLDKSIAMNAGYEAAGPLMTKGRYFFELPWPMRDLRKSADWLNKCIAHHPENLRCHVWLSETLLRDGKAKEANVHLQHALNGDSAYNVAEAARVKGMAKKLQPEVAKELK